MEDNLGEKQMSVAEHIHARNSSINAFLIQQTQGMVYVASGSGAGTVHCNDFLFLG